MLGNLKYFSDNYHAHSWHDGLFINISTYEIEIQESEFKSSRGSFTHIQMKMPAFC